MDTVPPRAHMRLRSGADPWPVIESLAAQLEALTVTVTALAHCFAPLSIVPRDTPAGPAPKPERRRFGQPDPDTPDATGVVPPDPAA